MKDSFAKFTHGQSFNDKTAFSYVCIRFNHLLISCWTDVNHLDFAVRFKFIRQSDVVPEQTVSWHFDANNTCQDCTSVKSNSHLFSE